MLDWTDKHCRYLHRLLSRHALLYSEMVTTGALLHGDKARHLDFNAAELPLALQLGGSEPADLAQCARLARQDLSDAGKGRALLSRNVGRCQLGGQGLGKSRQSHPGPRQVPREFAQCLQ